MSEKENMDYGCYEVKLNRWFYFSQEANIRWMICVPLLPLGVLLLCVLGAIHPVYFFMSIVISSLLLFAKLRTYPRCIDVTPNSIKICYRDMFLNILLRIPSSGDYEQTLYNIKSISSTQTPFERRMHVGQIHIIGDSISTETENAVVTESRLTVYGVKDFENTYEWLMEFVNIKNS